VSIIRLYRSLGPIDLKNVGRDSMLLWMPALPVLMALLARWGIPALTDLLAARFGFDLTPYYGALMSFLLPMAAMFVGVVTGFLILDERDDRTLTALMVTPLSLNGYLTYRLSAPLVVSTVLSLVAYPLVGLIPLPVGTLVAIALLSGFAAPILALTFGVLAENKVAGLALQKLLGTVLFLPVLAYFLPEPLQWLAGVFPTYWPLKVFWLAAAGQPIILPLAIGVAVNALALALLVRAFDRVARR
jgi:fluoroquinolone transport system permease protein